MRDPLQRICQQKEEIVTLTRLAGSEHEFSNVTASDTGKGAVHSSE